MFLTNFEQISTENFLKPNPIRKKWYCGIYYAKNQTDAKKSFGETGLRKKNTADVTNELEKRSVAYKQSVRLSITPHFPLFSAFFVTTEVVRFSQSFFFKS